MADRVFEGRHILQWHITHRCNLRCTHCYQTDYAARMSREQLFSALDRYERFLILHSLRGQINLTGGEPLTHPDFFDLALEIRRRGMDLAVLTNGTLITPALAHRLALLQPVFVQVSLDGTERVHDTIRGPGSWRRALDGIDLLKAAGLPVHVSFTAHRKNARSLLPLALVCRAHRVDKLWFDRVVIPRGEDRAGLTLSTEEFRRLVRTASRLRRRTPLRCDRALQFLCSGDSPCYRCGAGGDLLIFLADGGIMPCRRLPFVIGNVEDGELEDLLQSSPVMQSLRCAPVPDACAGCEYAERCRGGAKCVTYAQTGELFSRDVNCWLGKNSS